VQFELDLDSWGEPVEPLSEQYNMAEAERITLV